MQVLAVIEMIRKEKNLFLPESIHSLFLIMIITALPAKKKSVCSRHSLQPAHHKQTNKKHAFSVE